MQQFESFSTNVPIIGEDLLKAFYGTDCIIYSFAIQVISEKHYIAKVLPGIGEILLQENNCSKNSCKFSYKFAFILFLSILTKKSKNKVFEQVYDMVTINIFLFTASRALLHIELNRLLQINFATCYSCSYYTSILLL